MLNEEIRLNNLMLLVQEAGSIVNVANRCDTSAAYLSQIINKAPSSTGQPRGVGNKLARKLEDGFGKPRGWIDLDHSNYDLENLDSNLKAAEKSNVIYKNRFCIKQFDDVRASMGKGILLQDQPGQITTLEVTEEWINKNVPFNTGNNNLCIVTGFGDSMKGMFNPGDPLLIDTGIKSISELGDGVYFFRVENEGFIKRLQRVPGEGIRVISQNKEYPMWLIKKDMDFQVLGKVLKVWQSEKF